MPEPLSVSALVVGYASLQLLARPGSAISAEADALWRKAVAVMRSVAQSQALFGAKATAISQLWALMEECAGPNWDGDQALPLSREAALRTEDFIRSLPDALPMPELSPEPDGSISLDWIRSRHRLLSLSIGTSDRLAFAWLDGSDRAHGVIRFDGERIPAPIIEGITAVMDRGDAAVGTA